MDFELRRFPAEKAWQEICKKGGGEWDRLAFYEQRGRFHVDIDPESEDQRGLLYLGDGGWRQV